MPIIISHINGQLSLQVLGIFCNERASDAYIEEQASSLHAAALFCFMYALGSSSLWTMKLLILGHAANNGDIQQGEVVREKNIQYHAA